MLPSFPTWLEVVIVAVALYMLGLRRASMSRPTIIGWITIGSMYTMFAVHHLFFHGKATLLLDIVGGVLLFATLILWTIGSRSKSTSSRRWILGGIVVAVLIVLFSVVQGLHAIP